MSEMVGKITIQGFKSIKSLDSLDLKPINILIGANGAGKSNLVSFFRLLRELVDQNLQKAVNIEGGADACLYLGPRETPKMHASLRFGDNGYNFTLVPTNDNRLIFSEEAILYTGYHAPNSKWKPLATGHSESKLKNRKDDPGMVFKKGVAHYVYESISSWVVYHFHDTSSVAGVRRPGAVNDNEVLRPGAENLAAFLMRIQAEHGETYTKIRDAVRLAAPFFDDFRLRPIPATPHLTQLEWRQQGSDYPFLPSQLSDGTLRFICLATALLQPYRPVTILFDEPELGLHPYALTILAGVIKQSSSLHHNSLQLPRQAIISTQSPLLLSEFEPEDVVVVDRAQGESLFRRVNTADLEEWLSEYTLGDLWQKNLLGGRPSLEAGSMQRAF